MGLLEKIKPGSRAFKITLFIVVGTLVVVGGALITLWDYYDPEKAFSDHEIAMEKADDQNDAEQAGDRPANGVKEAEEEQEGSLVVNFLLLGFDYTEQKERFGREELSAINTDTIMFVSVDFRENQVKALSIPRDCKVPIANLDFEDKINHAYRHGMHYGDGDDSESRHQEGIRYALDTIENVVSAPIDYHVCIDIDNLIEIVDLMGGIYYDVERDIRADRGRGRVLIEEGYQHLDGEHFFYYVQYRGYARGDMARIDRQQQILKSALDQFRETGRLSKVPRVFNTLRESIETNLNSRHIGSLLRFLQDLKMEDITFYSFEVDGVFEEHGFYKYIDEAHRKELLYEMLGVEAEPLK